MPVHPRFYLSSVYLFIIVSCILLGFPCVRSLHRAALLELGSCSLVESSDLRTDRPEVFAEREELHRSLRQVRRPHR